MCLRNLKKWSLISLTLIFFLSIGTTLKVSFSHQYRKNKQKCGGNVTNAHK